jgi:hypothetical protein
VVGGVALGLHGRRTGAWRGRPRRGGSRPLDRGARARKVVRDVA